VVGGEEIDPFARDRLGDEDPHAPVPAGVGEGAAGADPGADATPMP
jgi:hypothetical protein